jgi:hypothetical protein
MATSVSCTTQSSITAFQMVWVRQQQQPLLLLLLLLRLLVLWDKRHVQL